jgi:hypothetical protein
MSSTWVIILLLAAFCILVWLLPARKSARTNAAHPAISDISCRETGTVCDVSFQIRNSLATNVTSRLSLSALHQVPGRGIIIPRATTNVVIRLAPGEMQVVTQKVALAGAAPGSPPNGANVHVVWTEEGF